MVKLIDKEICIEAREAVQDCLDRYEREKTPSNEGWLLGIFLQNVKIPDSNDMAEIKDGTGRATCRQCGKKIQKGEKSIGFFYSLSESSYNSWTACWCQIHLDNCN